jgi:hypothetical protein
MSGAVNTSVTVHTSMRLIPARELTCCRGGNLACETVDRHLPTVSIWGRGCRSDWVGFARHEHPALRNPNHLAVCGKESTKLETRRLYLFQQFRDSGGGGGRRVSGNDGIRRAAAADEVLGLQRMSYHLHEHV